MTNSKPTVFIPAAGLGTRLGVLTANCPKALVEYQGKPLLLHLLEKLQREGFRDIVINVHHHAQQIIDYVQTPAVRELYGSIAISDESRLLLDTGGALVKALPLLHSEDVLVYNVDIFSDINLSQFHEEFCNSDADALLAVRERNTSRKLLFDKDSLQLCGWRNEKTEAVKIVEGRNTTAAGATTEITALAFSGIHIIKTTVIKELQKHFGSEKAFSI
ncbi:MAG: NTP transferase domain-containing protein, partial [Bacteroidales bacterium]|nr:NTP transferase domain-containing protein [Bacteroidales bacterium]